MPDSESLMTMKNGQRWVAQMPTTVHHAQGPRTVSRMNLKPGRKLEQPKKRL